MSKSLKVLSPRLDERRALPVNQDYFLTPWRRAALVGIPASIWYRPPQAAISIVKELRQKHLDKANLVHLF